VRSVAPPSTLLVTSRAPVALSGVDQRAERDLLAERVAHRQLLHLPGEDGGVLLGDRLVHQVPAGGHADLALVGERPHAPTEAGRRHVDVGQHDERGVAPELQVRA
jgi:hypothetical protein